MKNKAPSPTTKEMVAFMECFAGGTRFWTSEDGSLSALVIERSPDVDAHDDETTCRCGLFSEFWWIKGVDWTKRLEPTFVCQDVNEEWHDGPGSTEEDAQRPLWGFSDAPTPYPVWKLEL